MRFALVISLLILFNNGLLAQKTCAKCLMPLIDSGERKAEFGKITKVMKCANEHAFTVPLNPAKSKKNNPNKTSCSCPVCGWFGHLTEHPNVRKCGNGHEFECR